MTFCKKSDFFETKVKVYDLEHIEVSMMYIFETENKDGVHFPQGYYARIVPAEITEISRNVEDYTGFKICGKVTDERSVEDYREAMYNTVDILEDILEVIWERKSYPTEHFERVRDEIHEQLLEEIECYVI